MTIKCSNFPTAWFITLGQIIALNFLLCVVQFFQKVENPPAMQETQVQSLGWEDLLEKGMAIHFHGQKILVAS